MTDVVLSEPVDTQSLMSFTRDISEGGGAVIPASHAARVRKVRPSQLKGKRTSDLKENRSMTQKPIQHKDYLSEQRAKRLGKPKVRGRESAKTSKTKQQDKNQEKEEEEAEKESVVAMNEENDSQDSRLISAGSTSSKDEGISSNGEKEEDFETEEGAKVPATTDDAQPVTGEADDDDEGRGSIKDESEELPDQFNDEVLAENDRGENTVDETTGDDDKPKDPDDDDNKPTDPDDEDKVADLEEAAPPTDSQEHETVPESDKETTLDEGNPELEEDANGYCGDMDEPNSLAASHQEVVGLSANKGQAAAADIPAVDIMEDAEVESERKIESLEEEKEEPTSEEKIENEESTESVVNVNITITEEQTEELQENKEEKTQDDETKEEEEIKEIPALSKISGRHQSKKLTSTLRKHETDPTRTPRRKINRKPISWRPGPIQATSNQSDSSKQTQKKFKARMPMENSAKQEWEGNSGIDESEEDNDRGGGDMSGGEAAGTELVVPLNLDTFRSEGHIESLAEEELPVLEKSESLPDIPRPSTAGRKNKVCKRRKARSRINSTWKKNELPQDYTSRWSLLQRDASTSEVWVPEENRLYVYTYSSEPRLLHVRRMGSRRGVVTTDLGDHDPNSSFRLRNR